MKEDPPAGQTCTDMFKVKTMFVRPEWDEQFGTQLSDWKFIEQLPDVNFETQVVPCAYLAPPSATSRHEEEDLTLLRSQLAAARAENKRLMEVLVHTQGISASSVADSSTWGSPPQYVRES